MEALSIPLTSATNGWVVDLKTKKTCKELNKLLQPNELKPFVERHPEFVWYANGKKGMIIQWACDGLSVLKKHSRLCQCNLFVHLVGAQRRNDTHERSFLQNENV